ncbi:2Fe-2S iron-sulfur cluster-binding protein [Kitasatospora kifunensis]|uniref:Carbon-monoxide dehydrogenase small subunit n=1 Tax=Kitasatospora kifunensis TaxID=58351 RepID=A0A7W7R507_KITKI|nr:carbon-monoxide dehydrogenase small subunit [Kitasatospora kifunensis]
MATEPTNHPVALGDGRPTTSYTLRVNGFERPVTDAWIGESLLYVLRERLGLAGAKNGCEQGECGACSVQVDGQLVAGCLVPAALAADSEINTVEGLSAAGAASDVQQALAESGAVQCGYCTPGMAMAVHDLLQRNHRPSEVEARQALCGNLCRCTGYRSVLAAVQTVADARGAALLEVEQAAEQAAEAAGGTQALPESGAPATPGPEAPALEPVGGPAPVDPMDPPVYQDAWTETATTGEVPLFGADGSGWISADPAPVGQQPPTDQHVATALGTGTGLGVIPAQNYPGYDSTAYGPGTVYDGGSSYEPTPAHGTAAPGAPFEGTPAHGTPYEPTPAHGVPYDGTPAHGTVYQAAPPYAAGPYTGAPYPGVAYDGIGYQGTPAHGIPAPGTPFDGTVYETAPAMPETGTPAHGLLLPEDDHA